ncbi:MAG: aldo/keto reductase [Lentisphaeria bacterium]|nr:aldo/keto reductase [Lentisphaeria bacterium]
MKYRRFGRTELQMPVISCGGMRYQQSWQDIQPDEKIDPAGQENLKNCIYRSFDLGINHIETARGYGTSEYQLGLFLKDLPRDEMIIQTKVSVKDSPDLFLADFELSMNRLQLDYVDLLSFHGINNDELLNRVINQGQMEVALKLKEQGRIRHIGFSTHGPTPTLLNAVKTDAFDYINLHWYYFDQKHWQVIEEAAKHDMGVFIISPTDKGGMLQNPPQKLTDLCAPMTPIGFNGLFCLSHPQVHTLSCGVAKPEEFNELVDIVPLIPDASKHLAPILVRLESTLNQTVGVEWAKGWATGLPEIDDTPYELNLYHTLRLLNMYEAYDMLDFAKSRYNLLGNGGHWFAGSKVGDFDDAILLDSLKNYPFAKEVPAKLRYAHKKFNAEDNKRLSES